MDFFIQKTTELGVNSIIPILSEYVNLKNNEYLQKRIKHWNNIAISSSEQCGRCSVPKISFAENISNLIINPSFPKTGKHSRK